MSRSVWHWRCRASMTSTNGKLNKEAAELKVAATKIPKVEERSHFTRAAETFTALDVVVTFYRPSGGQHSRATVPRSPCLRMFYR